MTQDEIIEMARQAGFEIFIQESPDGLSKTVRLPPIKPLEAFAKLVAAKERLDCFDAAYQAYATSEVLKAIRARGET